MTIYLLQSGGLGRVRDDYKKFFLLNCTSHEQLYADLVRDNCNEYDSVTNSCTYEWQSESYSLNSEGVYEFGCMNYNDREHSGCEGVSLLRVTVSGPGKLKLFHRKTNAFSSLGGHIDIK